MYLENICLMFLLGKTLAKIIRFSLTPGPIRLRCIYIHIIILKYVHTYTYIYMYTKEQRRNVQHSGNKNSQNEFLIHNLGKPVMPKVWS